MKLAVIIPAFNESANISRVIRETKDSQPSAKIVVVNDCSTDNTDEIVRSASETVLSLPCNLGIGGAVQTGLRYAREKEYDAAVQVDGDGQHVPSEIDKLLVPLASHQADVVIGSRFLGSESFKSTFARRIGIRILSLVNSALTRSRITDNTSGFRAYNREAIAFLSEHYPQDFPEPIAVIDLFRNGFRIVEVSVSMRERQGGTSSISAVKSIYYMLKVLIASLIAYTRKPVSEEM